MKTSLVLLLWGALTADSASAAAALKAPTGLTAVSPSSSQVNLQWSYSTTRKLGLETFIIYRDGAQVGAVPAQQKSYSDSGLQAATSYRYQVQAVATSGSKSALSAAVSVPTQSAAIPQPDPTPTPPPTTSVPPIPDLENWKARMISGGRQFCDEASINSAISSTGVTTEGNVWYYDGSRVYQQIAAYTGDNSFYTCAGYSNNAYRSFVLAMTDGVTYPVGRMNGWRVFPHGLYMDYLRTGDVASKEAVRRLALYSAFAEAGGGAHCGLSRETAYMIQAYIHQEKIGLGRNPLLATAVNYALGHIDQWVVSRSCPAENTQPFMMGLTAAALIEYYELTKDPRIQGAIQTLVDGMWNLFWVPGSTAFVYDTVSASPAADLNLLIAPAYAWMWQMTGDQVYIERGDQVFSGGTLYANFWTGKQFSQSYRWSFDYVKWRSAAAGTYK